MNAMGLIDEILHYVAGLYRQRIRPEAFTQALSFVEARLGAEAVRTAIAAFRAEFPAPDESPVEGAPAVAAGAPEAARRSCP